MEELKQALKEKSLVIGKDRTMKRLREGSVKAVFLASNCSNDTKEIIKYYAKFSDVKVVELDIPNTELGSVCKRPYSISVLSY